MITTLPRPGRSLLLILLLTLGAALHAHADSAVVFNEVNYHPATVAQSEWIELHSLQGVNVDLSGWKLTGGIEYTFPAGTTIAGHGYVVVAANPSSASLSGAGALGPWTGALNNAGEEIRLVNKSGRIMDSVSYSDGGSWPTGADGSGATLAKLNSESADAGASHWTASSRVGGSPGAVNFATATSAPTLSTPVPLTGTWKYRDDDVAPPAAWTSAAYDDSAWLGGNALLYAGNPNITGAGEGLLGYWPLDETAGTNAPNLAVGGTAGTLANNPTWVADAQRGKVLNLPGNGAYVSAGTIPQIALDTDFTWSFWANSTATTGSSVIIGNRYMANGLGSSPLEFIKFTPSSFEFYRSDGQDGISYGSMPANSWVHHAVVKSKSTLSYYRNGVLSSSKSITQGLNAAQPFYFGGDKTNESWAGKLDDVAIWAKALPASSINGLSGGSFSPLSAPTGSSSAALTKQVTFGPVTHYFRRSFTFNGAKERTTLTLQHMVDDGAVFYLNGVKVLGYNMPADPVTHSTLALVNQAGVSLSAAVTIPSDALVNGLNVLAVEVHQASATAPNNDMVFGAQLSASETPAPARYPGTGLVFNEISAATDAQFQIELLNNGSTPLDLAGFKILSSSGASATLAPQTLAPGALTVISAAQLGFTPLDNDKLFLLQPNGSEFEDSRSVSNKLRGRASAKNGDWLYPSAPSFGAANTFSFNSAVVINELMYDPHPKALWREKWIELYNRGAAPVDLGGWKMGDGVSYTFPAGTTIAAGAYLVVSDDVAAFNAHRPGVPVLGPFGGSLSGKGEHIQLEDAAGNPVDEVRYYTGGRWPENANGKGASLERRNARADSNAAETWAASDETARGSWQTVTWQGTAANFNGDPTQWNEFLLGLLDDGSFLIDDISVIESPGANQRQLIQNGSFATGAATWRFLGTHRNATVVSDPSGTGQVLQVTTSGGLEHMHNHIETTLKNSGLVAVINSSLTYQISFRARWVSGSNQLLARLYFNRLPRVSTLPIAEGGGTPGAANSTAAANIGPSYSNLTHSPVVPAAGQPATVSVTATDPDGMGAVNLFYSVNGAAFVSTPITLQAGRYSGTVPAQGGSAKVQFYVQAADTAGATAFFPKNGPASRAMIPWNDGQARLSINGVSPNNVRVVMPVADITTLHTTTNVMSNDHMPCTVIYNENVIFYDSGIRLKGSERGRAQDTRVSFNIDFPADNLLLGTHDGVAIDRSGAGNQTSQKEILIKRAISGAGDIPGSEDDLCRVIAPLSQHTGPAILVKERFSSTYLDNQYANGADGPMFKYELIYYPTSNVTPGNVESLKLPEPDAVVGVPMVNLGNDKELHRWHWLILNNQEVDDYSGLMTWLTAYGLPAGTQYFTQTEALMDVDEWLRSWAVEILFGIGDNYATGSQHNFITYQRPSDKRWLFFPHDMDFTFNAGSTSSMVPNSDLAKLLSKPANARGYYGHLNDLCNSTFSSTYLQPWAVHYNAFLNEDLTANMTYINERRATALNAINTAIPPVAFSITSNGGAAYSVGTPFTTITGRGWVNVREIRLSGSTQPLTVTWTSNNTWQVTVPLGPGSNNINLQAVGFDGSVLSTTSQTITNTGPTVPAAGNLAITELMYHPPLPTASEQLAGYSAAGAEDEFEFVELTNISASSVDITGTRFSDGFEYTFPSRVLLAGERVVVARNPAAFSVRYPGVAASQRFGPFTTGKLSDSGETLILTNAGGATILSVLYGDAVPWPGSADGAGPSLVLIRPQTNPNANLPENWRHSAQLNGNPAASDVLTYDAWKSANNVANDNEDPDADGMSAFLEYAHGTSAILASGTQDFLSMDASGFATLSYRRRIGAEDVNWELQTAATLSNPTTWITSPSSFVYAGVDFNLDGTEWVHYRLAAPVSSEAKRFVRERVSR